MGKYFHHSSGKLFYTDHGSGIPVIFVHGYLETSAVWSGFAEDLADRFRVITTDLPGHGKSDILGAVHSMDLMAGVLYDLIVSLHTGTVFMVGHSMGGYVTMAFVDKFPDMLTGYCLFHSHPFADTPEAIAKREMEIKLVRAGNKDKMFPESISKLFARNNLEKFAGAVARSEEIAADIPADGIVAVLKGMMERPSRVKIMEEGKVPCLWILGTHDSHINCDKIQERVKLPSNARVEILKNSGHMGFIEEKEISLDVLTKFIKNPG